MIGMLLVVEQPGTCPVARSASLWDRIVTSTRSFALDTALAAGVAPEATVRLALRAERLTEMAERHQVARGIRSILARVDQPRVAGRPAVVVCHDRVHEAADEFERLADRLESPAPVLARGVAETIVLLHDGRSPLYRRSSREDLRTRVRQAIHALDALPTW
jgi:hypothetical protein